MDAHRSEPDSQPHPAAPRSGLASSAGEAVHGVFDSYHAQFKLVTRRARARFETRDWRGAQQDAVERLTLYRQFVEWTVRELHRLLGGALTDRDTWDEMKRVYSRLAAGRNDIELAYTFFNSISRRVLATVGVDPLAEYVREDFERRPSHTPPPIWRTYEAAGDTRELCRAVLEDLPFRALMRDPDEDATLVARALERCLAGLPGSPALEAAEVIPELFYRKDRKSVV